ncbi:MAG: hypothetical protein AAGA69_10220 [Pseudomonadota bacterium]
MGKIFAILLSLAFLIVQTVTLAHATEFGDEDHSHHGAECVLIKAGDRTDGDSGLPCVGSQLVLPRLESSTTNFTATTLLIPTVTHSPPGRAPPHA